MNSYEPVSFLNSPIELATSDAAAAGLDLLIDRLFKEWAEEHHASAPETDPEFAALKELIAQAIISYEHFRAEIGNAIPADPQPVLRSPVETQKLIKRLQLMRP